jgi:predicted TIM-barrel fold metal-dependent hydrolase
MGGSLEILDLLARRLEKYPHYILDTSATKWMVRAVAEQSPQAVRDFFVAFQDRIIFGSDLVVGDKYDWDHYASRYWALQMMWETRYQGESPIEDPDGGQGFDPRTNNFSAARADGKPRLQGVDLPEEVLLKIYRTNAQRLLPR